jgi:hypothetical protein
MLYILLLQIQPFISDYATFTAACFRRSPSFTSFSFLLQGFLERSSRRVHFLEPIKSELDFH